MSASLLSAEMRALMDRVLRDDGPQPDPTMLPAPDGRALSAETNRRWNVNLPAMASDGDDWIEGSPALGSSRCRVRHLVPHGAEGNGAILFLHGGGFAFCSPETHERCARVLADEARMPVYVPDYRLAPEHPFPAGLRDVVATLRALTQGQLSAQRPEFVIVAGDSAGANLALASLLHEHDGPMPMPAGALLFYGNYATDFETESYRRFADGPGLTRAKMQRYWAWYAGNADIANRPMACPLTASDEALDALPPLYLMAAEVDPLLSDTIRLSRRLAALGRSDETMTVPGVVHGFLQNTNDLQAARRALAAAGAAARRMARNNNHSGGKR